MIGIIVMTHGELGLQIISTARLIGLHSENGLKALSIDPANPPDKLRDSLGRAIKELDRGDGVLILTDLFGGTPTNLSLSFLSEGKVEVVTGVNLPMLIRAVNSREAHDLQSLSKDVSDAGQESIFLAGEVLRRRLAPNDEGDVES